MAARGASEYCGCTRELSGKTRGANHTDGSPKRTDPALPDPRHGDGSPKRTDLQPARDTYLRVSHGDGSLEHTDPPPLYPSRDTYLRGSSCRGNAASLRTTPHRIRHSAGPSRWRIVRAYGPVSPSTIAHRPQRSWVVVRNDTPACWRSATAGTPWNTDKKRQLSISSLATVLNVQLEPNFVKTRGFFSVTYTFTTV